MKQILGVVVHQAGGAFQIEIRQGEKGYYGKWSCKACGAGGQSSCDFDDSGQAFASVKKMIAAHDCGERSSTAE